MLTPGLIKLSPADIGDLVDYARRTKVSYRATQGAEVESFPPLPDRVVKSLELTLGPNGLGPHRSPVGFVPCELHQPAFAAQFIVAYYALAGRPNSLGNFESINSYTLKHVVEYTWQEVGLRGSIYVSNGAVILAALAVGHAVYHCPLGEDLNALIELGQGWRDTIAENLRRLATHQRVIL